MGRINSPIPTRKLVATSTTYKRGYHRGDAGGLVAVEEHLVEGNIADGVEIFGVLGTLVVGTIVHDDQDLSVDSGTEPDTATVYHEEVTIGAGADETLETITLTALQATIIEAVYFLSVKATVAARSKLQLFVDGVAQAETAFITVDFHLYYELFNGVVASGARTVYVNGHDYVGSPSIVYWTGGVFAAVCKLV